MKRSIKSNQREVTQLHFICNAAGTAVTGLDANQVTLADTGTGVKTITLSDPLQNMVVQATAGTDDVSTVVSVTNSTTIVVTTNSTEAGAAPTDGIVHVTVTGSRVSDQY
jgi:hypothetical protein